MVLDIPTLSFAVLLVMLLASLSLTAHWLANRRIGGLREIAVGLVSFSVGNCILFDTANQTSAAIMLFGETLILMGHFWIWLGISDFWQSRTQKLVLLAGGLTLIAIASLTFQALDTSTLVDRGVTLSLFTAALSLGVVRTLVQALGGHLGFYKGMVRRTTVGAGLAAGLFIIHALYGLYHGFTIGKVSGETALFLTGTVYLEALAFVMLLALVVIIMTAEHLQAELKIQEMMDPLTRSLNRRAFLEVMKAVLARARRLAEPVSLVMVDIDKFKKVNMDHGRVVGDLALAEFAALVMEGRRSQDVFCRFGGEEFVLMLPGTPEEGADLVAARIKAKIEKSSVTPNSIPLKLTISLGVVTARGDDLDADGMLDVVDRRMHHAQKLSFEKIETAG